jgi:hypothetical protein
MKPIHEIAVPRFSDLEFAAASDGGEVSIWTIVGPRRVNTFSTTYEFGGRRVALINNRLLVAASYEGDLRSRSASLEREDRGRSELPTSENQLRIRVQVCR